MHESIIVLTRDIQAGPASAALYLRRASLYAESDHFTEALADLDLAEKLDPGNDVPSAVRAGIFRRSGRLAEARSAQEAFLKKHPANALVRYEYCQTLAAQKDDGAAIRELDTLIAAVAHPPPDAVAMRLKLTESLGPGGPDAALTWIAAFVRKHPLPVFEEEALRLELQLRRHAEALQRLDAMIAKAPRPESLLLRKADVLSAAGDAAGARTAAAAAAAAIARLPAHIRSNRATAALEERARLFLSP